MSLAPIVMLAPHVIELLKLAMQGIEIIQKPDATDAEIEAYAARARLAGDRLDQSIKDAIARQGG